MPMVVDTDVERFIGLLVNIEAETGCLYICRYLSLGAEPWEPMKFYRHGCWERIGRLMEELHDVLDSNPDLRTLHHKTLNLTSVAGDEPEEGGR